MSYNEFELLEVADDIEQGDSINVEDQDTGESLSMVFVRKDKSNVVLKAMDGSLYRFCQRTLEHHGEEPWIITGKAE